VEAGGNGNVNTGNLTWFGNSGAVIVGAGGGLAADNLRKLGFSSYGPRFDVQGWGENVMTTGYGSYYNLEGLNYYYRSDFNGTSSASPIVTSAIACFEGYWKSNVSGTPPTPANMRAILKRHGRLQVNPGEGLIGNRPDLKAMITGYMYCTASSITCDEYISRVQFGSIDNSSVCNNYVDYTSICSTDLAVNGTQQIIVTNGNPWASDQCGIWVDWNRDGDFYDANEAISVTGATGVGPYTAIISPPAGQTLGACRVRVRITYTGAVDPCGTTNYGEVEDYTVNITSPVDNIWTGVVSNNWHDPANWNLLHVPYSTDNTVIPNGTPYFCWIWTDNAACNNLTIGSGTYLRNYDKTLNVNGNLSINGQLMMDNSTSSAITQVYGNINWNSGSTAWTADATIIKVAGNWNFYAGANAQLAGGVMFFGSTNSFIYSYDADCSFLRFGNYKPAGSWVSISSSSTASLTINDSFYSQTDATTYIYSTYPVIIKGEFYNNGHLYCGAGTVVFDGTTHGIEMNAGDYFNNLTVSSSGGVILNTNTDINGNVLIESGTLVAGGNTINVGGNWTNSVGLAGFNEGTSRVVFDGPGHQLVKSNETFNILEAKMGAALRIEDPAGFTVTCNQYDWTSGGIDVIEGTFTAFDLAENGIYGGYWLNDGGTINLTNDGWIDLDGNLNIYGGNFNVYGGSADSDWPYLANASITMSGGILDFKNHGIRAYNSPTYSLTENITGGTIRTAIGFENQRTDFTPYGSTIEMYGTTDAYITTALGCSVYNVVINKGADDGGTTLTDLFDREGKPIPQTRASTAFAGSSPVTILGNLNINSGTFDMNTRTVNVTNTVNINAATFKMIAASDNLTAYTINWNSGSNDNVTNGVFNSFEWGFWDGTNAQLGTGNTANVKLPYFPTDSDAEFGNLVAVPFSKTGGEAGKAYFPYKVAGNFTLQSGVNWDNMAVDIIVTGNSVIENGGTMFFVSGADFYANSNLTLAGTIILGSGSAITVNGDFIFPNTGVLNVGTGVFTNNYSTGMASLAGTLQLTTGTVEFPNRSVSIFSSFNDQISGGVFRVGKTLSANIAGTFQPLAGTVEFVNTSSGNYVQVTNGNYLYNMELTKPASTFIVYDDLTIKGTLFINDGVLNSNNKTISIAGNWYNFGGDPAFTETAGKVIFNGSGAQYCSGENFYILEVNKPADLLYNAASGNITCQVYDWTSGGIFISPGNFSADDLADNGLFGSFAIYDGTMDLHQDNSQFVDVNGNITIGTGGYLNVYGGSGTSWWPYSANASVTMSGGVMDFKNVGIYVHNSASYTFSENITAGTIRSPGSFEVLNTGFTPSGGTVELYGGTNANIMTIAGSYFKNLIINKSGGDKGGDPLILKDHGGNLIPTTRGNEILVEEDVMVNGTLAINAGKLNSGNQGYDVTCMGDVNIETGATIDFIGTSQLKLNTSLTVKNGGTFRANGTPGYYNYVTRANTNRYLFSVQSGGNISANNAIFEYMGADGINIASGAVVDPAQAFNSCTFRQGLAANTLLTMNSSQELSCTGAIFPANVWGGASNVKKSLNAGRITFTNFSGDFSGPAFEVDPFNRVDWFVPTLSASPLTLNVNPPAGTTTFNITSNLAWTVAESSTWFSVNTASGSNNATITVTFDQNTSASSRSANITISAAGVPDVIVTVIQAGATLSVLPATQNVTAPAGTTTFNVTSNTSWTVAESVSWFSVLPMSGSGNGTLTVTYTQNASVTARSGQITVSSTGLPNVVVTVNQAGAGATLSVLPANRDVTPPASTTTFTLTSNTGWAVSESVSWLSVLPMSGTGNGTLTVTYNENATGSSRVGSIVVTATGGSPAAPVTVTQASYPTQSVALAIGWQGLSSYIMPTVTNIPTLFTPIAANFTILQNLTGVYYPAGSINTIGLWASQSAYSIKMNAASTLPIIGPLETNKTFALANGWNLMPVICNTNVTTSTLVSGLGVNLGIIKEIAGSKVYWPAYGIYTLSQLTPGKAYYVRMTAASSVTFPANVADNGFIPDEPIRELATPWNNIHRTTGSHIFAIPAQALTDLSQDDIIGIFTPDGICAGNIQIGNTSENHAFYTFADDQITNETDGFTDGQPMIFKLFRPSTGEEFNLEVAYNSEMPNNDGLFASEGMSAISSLKVSNVGISENAGQNIRIFPNPATGVVTVSGITEFSNIEIFTSDGSQVKTIQTENVEQTTFNIADLSKGIYQLRFTGSQSSVYKKLIKN
jgi:hypothetical protein